jgi:hypothetical protein
VAIKHPNATATQAILLKQTPFIIVHPIVEAVRARSPPPPNDEVQQRGRLQRLHGSESRHAGPVCCNGWFGPAHGLRNCWQSQSRNSFCSPTRSASGISK